jgi:hypothetical protein
MKKRNTLLLLFSIFAVSSFEQENSDKIRDWSQYKITQKWADAVDTNKGFIYDERNPILTFCFKDPVGNKAYADFKCHIKTFGFGVNLSLNQYFAKFSGANFSLKEAHENPVQIKGGGFICFSLLGLAGVDCHVAKLKNTAGTLVLSGPTLGISVGIGFIIGGKISMIGAPTFEDK